MNSVLVKLLHILYDADVLSENVLIKWHRMDKEDEYKAIKKQVQCSTVLLIILVVDQTIFCIFIMILQTFYKTKSIHFVVVQLFLVVVIYNFLFLLLFVLSLLLLLLLLLRLLIFVFLLCR